MSATGVEPARVSPDGFEPTAFSVSPRRRLFFHVPVSAWQSIKRWAQDLNL